MAIKELQLQCFSDQHDPVGSDVLQTQSRSFLTTLQIWVNSNDVIIRLIVVSRGVQGFRCRLSLSRLLGGSAQVWLWQDPVKPEPDRDVATLACVWHFLQESLITGGGAESSESAWPLKGWRSRQRPLKKRCSKTGAGRPGSGAGPSQRDLLSEPVCPPSTELGFSFHLLPFV